MMRCPPRARAVPGTRDVAAGCSPASRAGAPSVPGTASLLLEQLLELHRRAHVALDLELAGHVGARRVLLARHDLLERLLGRRDHSVRVAPTLGHGDLAVVDVDLPLAGAVDVED